MRHYRRVLAAAITFVNCFTLRSTSGIHLQNQQCCKGKIASQYVVALFLYHWNKKYIRSNTRSSYRAPSSASLESREEKAVISAGRPYLTKVNGKLVMARQKRDRSSNAAIELLGEAFGVRTRTVHKRTKSIEGPTSPPLMIAGTPYVAPQLFTYSTPIPQQGFPPLPPPAAPTQYPQPAIMPYPPGNYPSPIYEQPTKYTLAPHKPTAVDFEQLKKIDADYKARTAPASTSKTIEDKDNTTNTIMKHVCANCGRIRSRKYHQDNPIKRSETPTPAFYRKCQRDASSTDCSDLNQKPPPSKSNKKNQPKVISRRSFVISKLLTFGASLVTSRRAKPKIHLRKALYS